MKKLVFTLLCCIYCVNFIYADTNYPDSLFQVLERTPDKTKSLVYTNIARHYCFNQPDSSLYYGYIGLRNASSHQNDSSLAGLHNIMGVACDVGGKPDSALWYYQQAIHYSKKSEAQTILAGALNNIGLIYWNKSEWEKAIDYYLQSVHIFEAIDNKRGIGNTYNNIGLILTEQKQYENALEYFYKSLRVRKTINDTYGIGASYLNLSNVYFDMNYADSTKHYLEKAIKVKKEVDDEYGLAKAYNNLGNYFETMGNNDLDSAIYYYNHSLFLQKKLGNIYGMASTYLNLSNLLKKRKRFTEAKSMLDSAQVLTEEHSALKILYKVVWNKALLFNEMGQYDSVVPYMRKHREIKDSVYSEERSKAILDLEKKYETELKEEEIELLNTQKQNNELTIQKQRLSLLVGALFVAIFSILAYFLFNRYRKKQKAKKEQELQVQKENERMRISRDMHDEVGAGLTRIVMRSAHVKMHLKSGEGLKNGIEETLEKMEGESRQLSHSIGEIIWALNPKNDTLDALCAYLRSYAHDYLEEADITCNIQFPDVIPNTPVSPEIRRNIFLILKESLNNIVKHAEASRVEIRLEMSGNQLSLRIKDNGKGIEKNLIPESGNGIGNMKKRTEDCGGKFVMTSEQGKGTEIRVEGVVITENPTKV